MLTKQVSKKHYDKEHAETNKNPRKTRTVFGIKHCEQYPRSDGDVDNYSEPEVLTSNVRKKIIVCDVEGKKWYCENTGHYHCF